MLSIIGQERQLPQMNAAAEPQTECGGRPHPRPPPGPALSMPDQADQGVGRPRSHSCERARQTPRASVLHSLNACSTNPLADARGLTVSMGTDPITKCAQNVVRNTLANFS